MGRLFKPGLIVIDECVPSTIDLISNLYKLSWLETSSLSGMKRVKLSRKATGRRKSKRKCSRVLLTDLHGDIPLHPKESYVIPKHLPISALVGTFKPSSKKSKTIYVNPRML